MKNRFFVYAAVIIMILNVNYSQSPETIITPYTITKHIDGQNIVYSSSFAEAWRMLKDDILKENVETEVKIDLVDMLNISNPAEVDPLSSVSLSGFVGAGIIEKINMELRRKFGKQSDLSAYADNSTNIICYSMFRKKMTFAPQFENFDSLFPFLFGERSKQVSCFGIWNAGQSDYHRVLRRLVRILYHHSPAEFIISLSNPDEEDEIVIAVTAPSNTLQETIGKVNNKIIGSAPEDLVNNDRLIIPKIKFETVRKYAELYGKHLANKGFEGYFFAEAIHGIGFELNESGASADSEAKLILKKGPGPRTMIVNRPFLLMMKKKGSDNPYLAVWIGNPELLIKEN